MKTESHYTMNGVPFRPNEKALTMLNGFFGGAIHRVLIEIVDTEAVNHISPDNLDELVIPSGSVLIECPKDTWFVMDSDTHCMYFRPLDDELVYTEISTEVVVEQPTEM